MSAPGKSRGNHIVAGEVAAGLVAQGISGAVVSPGSRNTPLVLAFQRHPELEVQVVLDERAAGFVALGMARSTGKPAVLICTSGSAGTHYLPAILEARYGRVPLIALTADRPAELHHCGAGQTVSQARFFGENIRWFADIPAYGEDTPRHWLQAVTLQAYAAATGSPAGPVHLNMAFREPLWDEGAQQTPEALTAPSLMRGRLALHNEDLRNLAERMQGAERGVLICGPLAPATVDAREFAAAVSSLSSTLGWPVIADVASGLRLGRHNHENIMGAADAMLRHPTTTERLKPTFALCLGQAPTSKAIGKWLSSSESLTLVDPDGAWHEPGCQADHMIAAEPITLCRQLSGLLSGAPRSDSQAAWIGGWRDLNDQAQGILDRESSEGTWEAGVARGLLAGLPDGAQLHAASSLAIRALDSFGGTSSRAVAVRANRGCNGIDGTMATALGASLSWSTGPTAVLMGDLAFLHDLGGLEAACQAGAPLTVVVVHNGGGGIFDHLPISEHPTAFERFFVTERGASISKLCDALGARHILATDLSSLTNMIRGAVEESGPSVIEVRVEREESLQRHQAAWNAVAEALELMPSDRAGSW